MFWYGGSLCKMVLEMGLNRLCVSWCPSYCTAWIISGTWSVVSFAILEPKSRDFAFYACQNFRSWYFVSETENRECSVSHLIHFMITMERYFPAFFACENISFTWLFVLRAKRPQRRRARPWNGCFRGLQPFVQTDQRAQSPEVVSYEPFIVIIRVCLVCIDSWQRNPSLDWSHRCLQCLANLNPTGPNCPVRSFLHLVFGRPCLLVHSLGVHSVALMVQRLSDSRAMWPAHQGRI